MVGAFFAAPCPDAAGDAEARLVAERLAGAEPAVAFLSVDADAGAFVAADLAGDFLGLAALAGVVAASGQRAAKKAPTKTAAAKQRAGS